MQRSFLILLSALYLLPAITLPVFAKRSCGSASCPLNNSRFLGAGFLSIGLSQEYINQNRLYLGSSLSFVGAIPEHHNEIQTLNERTILQAGYGFSDRLALQMTLPFIHREHSHIDHDNGGSQYQSWSFSGLGDVTFTGQFTLLHPLKEFEPYLSLTAGIKLATGATDLKNDAGNLAEVTIQPGSGSVDEIIGINFHQTVTSLPTLDQEFSALPVVIGVSYQFNGKGTNDYRFGNVAQVHIGSSFQFISWSNLLLQFNGKFQDFADVGSTGEPRENTGGTWIFVSPGLQVDLSDVFSTYGYVQLPIYQNVHGLQQTAPLNLLIGLSANFNLLGNSLFPGSHMDYHN